ncbi:MAG: UDP-N-acetylmuramoyl-L-alanyl-D-glutamate--2,6-diaminopimelate ligase, partial [Candidatus Aenigmatarchaeota archaeon]
GEIASKYASFTFITSDNPRNEDPYKICKEIQRGFKNSNYKLIIDRKEAIFNALRLKNKYKKACVLVAGKGHEDYQIIGDKILPFKDSEVIKELLERC